MFKNLSLLLLVSTASAYLGCEHAELGDENGMLREAECIFYRSDQNHNDRLSPESTNQFVRNYIEDE